MEQKKFIEKDLIRKTIKEFDTKNKEGFTREELNLILKSFNCINLDKFNGALFGITCMSIKGETVIYPWDVEKAIRCGLENRDLKEEEGD